MSDLQIFSYQSNQVRSVLIEDAPWFVASDVCRILELGNSRMALMRLDDDEKGVSSIDTPGGNQQMQIVNEPGLYSLILGSRKPEAKAFKRWVTHEVLPAIRQTGKYEIPVPKDADEQALILAAEVTRLITEKRQLQTALTEAQPKITAFDSLMDASGNYSMQSAAQMLGIGRTRLFARLRELKIIQPQPKRVPYQKYVDAGYFVVKAVRIENVQWAEYQPFVTPKGLDWLRKQFCNS